MSTRRYGEAGKGIEQVSHFGKNAYTGAAGERKLSGHLNRHPMCSRYFAWRSLRIPHSPGQTNYQSDVDMALASGNRLVLIDAKMYASGYTYWSAFGRVFKGTQILKDDDGNPRRLSRNMELAVTRYREALPGCRVEGVVIFVASGKKSQLPNSVSLLRWPGGIRSYLPNDGMRKIAQILGTPEEPSADIKRVLGNNTR